MQSVSSIKQVAAHKELERDPVGQYLASLRVENKSQRTIESYQYDLEAFRQWFGLPVEQADSITLTTYFDQLSRSPATIARKQSSLAMYFRWCIAMGILKEDPMAVMRRVKVPECLPRPLDDDKLKRFFLAVSTGPIRDKLLFTLLIETGLRISEALGLHWKDVELSSEHEKLIVMGKGGKERVIPLQNAAATLILLNKIKDGKSLNAPVFIGRAGQALSYSRALELFHVYRMEAKLPASITIHTLRHTFATNLLEDGVNILVAQKLLGHADLKTTSIYQLVSDQFVRKELLKRRNRLTS